MAVEVRPRPRGRGVRRRPLRRRRVPARARGAAGALVHGPRSGRGHARLRPRAPRHGRHPRREPPAARGRHPPRAPARLPRARAGRGARRSGAARSGVVKRGEIARHVTRGAFYLAVEKTAALISGMLYFALLLRWLGPTNYGMLTLALAITGLASISTGNLEVFLERFAAEYQARGRSDLLYRAHALAVGIKCGLGVLASVALLAVTPHLAVQFKMPELNVL